MDLLEKYHGTELYNNHTIALKRRHDELKVLEGIAYEEMLYNYRKFIRLVSELSADILTNYDSISLIRLIDLMMKMGYFSYGEQFKYGIPENSIMYNNMGATVVLGKGVCRHIASFATDVFKVSDKFCENFYCLITKKTQDNTLEGHGNHLANVINYKDINYVYDITNQELYNFKNPMQLISESKKNLLYYKPELELIAEKNTLEDIKTKLENYQASSLKNKIKRKELYEIEQQVSCDIIYNKNVLKDFKEYTKDIKEKVYTLSKNSCFTK